MSDAAEQFGPYRVLETIGRGGMGVVYRGEHVSTGEQVAVKTVLVSHEGLLHSIRREMHALSRMKHPGIIRILDEGTAHGLPWYAMELVNGVSLLAYCDGLRAGLTPEQAASSPDISATTHVLGSELGTSTSPPTQARPASSPDRSQHREGSKGPIPAAALGNTLTAMRRLCAPLAFLHGEGMVHRDLKPQNVLIKRDGVPILVDFGLATQFEGRLRLATLPATQLAEGTLSYMAPEVLAGEIADARADLYALGCVLYTLLAGRLPFRGSAAEIIDTQLHRGATPLRQLTPGLPEPLYELVERLLAPDPYQRIGHADDVAAVLARLGADDLPEAVARPTPRTYLYRPRFAGRAGVLDDLSRFAARLRTGCGGLALLGGESGVGKTRLMLEFLRRRSDGKHQVFSGECLPASGRPLEGLHGPLQAIADRCRALGADATRRIVGTTASVLALYEPVFTSLPGAVPQEAAPAAGGEARRRLWERLTETFRNLAEELPVILVLEDLQWADELTLSWLEHLVEHAALERIRLLIVGSYRTEECPDALRRLLVAPGVTSITLGRLEASDVASIVGDMLALRPPPALFSEHLARHSEGNPFFVAEYMRMAVGERLLARDDAGHWRLAEKEGGAADLDTRYSSLPLPGSLMVLVTRRFERLGPEAAAALAAASVLGRESDTAVLTQVAELGDAGALRACAELLRRQILEETSPGRLRFLHDKLREAAYGRLPDARRRELHRLAAQTLEAAVLRDREPAREQEQIEAQAAILAFHCLRAGADAKAARYSWLAGRHATRASALPEAIAHFETAVAIADRLPHEPGMQQLRVDARLDMYPARMHLHSAADEGLLRLCREAEPLLRESVDARRLTRLYAWFAGSHFARAEYDECIKVGQRGLEYAGEDLEIAAITGYIPAGALLQAGRLSTLAAMAPPILDGLEGAAAATRGFGQPYPPYVCLAGMLGWALALMGRFAEGDVYLEKAIDVSRQAGSKYALALSHALTGWSACVEGDGAAGIEHGQQAARIACEARLPGPEMFGMSSAGIGCVLSGRVDDGIALLEQSLAKANALKYVAFRSDTFYGLALAHASRGDRARVVEWCGAGLRAAATGERKLEAEFQRLLGEDALASGRLEDAREHLLAARSISEAQGAKVFLARAQLAMARLLLLQRRPRQAEAELRAAGEILRAAGLGGELQTVAQLLDECGPVSDK